MFASGFTLAAAEAVCGDRSLPDVLDLLTHLLDRSLVEADPPARGPGRYRLLETLRQYAWGRLIEAGEMETFRARHAAYYQALGALAIPELHGPKRKDGLDQLEREHDNLRTVLRFLLDRRDVDALSRLCEALGQLWMVRGHIDEGRAWLAEILKLVEASGRAQDHARLLRYDARLAHKQGNWTDAVTRMNQGLAIWRELGDREGMAGELGRLGLANRAHGDFAAARSLFEESLHLYRDLGLEEEVAKQLDRLGVTAFYQGDDATACTLLAESLTIRRRLNDPFWLGWALLVAGMVAHGQGNHAAARSWLDEALTTWRELGYREGVAIALGDLGDLLLDLGDLTAARSALTESLLLWRDVGGYLAIVEHDLECFGGLAAAQGEVQRALRLWGTAAALRERLGEPLPPDFKARRERRLAPIKESLSADAFRQGWAEGQTKTLEQAVAYALEEVRE